MIPAVEWLEDGWECRHPYNGESEESVYVQPLMQLKDDNCVTSLLDDLSPLGSCDCTPNSDMPTLRASNPLTDEEFQLWAAGWPLPHPIDAKKEREANLAEIERRMTVTSAQRINVDMNVYANAIRQQLVEIQRSITSAGSIAANFWSGSSGHSERTNDAVQPAVRYELRPGLVYCTLPIPHDGPCVLDSQPGGSGS